MIKNINGLLNLCTDFINEIDDFEDVEIHEDFECYPNTNEVFISLVASQNNIEEFMETLLERTEIKDISEFTWSLLHEVGHCETWSILNKRIKNHCKYIKKKIFRYSLPSILYYDLTDEKIATNWAINFVENNYDIVKEFDNKILECLKNLYIANEIEW